MSTTSENMKFRALIKEQAEGGNQIEKPAVKDKFLNTASAYHYIYMVTGKTPYGKSQKEVLKMANDLYKKPGESKWEHKKRISKEQLEEKKRRTAKAWKKRKGKK